MATEEGMDPAFRARLDALIAASNGKLYLNSGYRDNELQAKLYAQAVAKYGEANARKWVAPPGHSNHNRGLAGDLGGDLALAHQLAPQFGLEFPMSWEPWHIEPVGLRERNGTSPQAYTQGQPGTVNPTEDPLINTKPETIFARLASVLTGAGTEATAGGGFTAPGDGMAASTGGRTGATGGAPSGTEVDVTKWATDFLTQGGFPTTPQNLKAIEAWARAEGGAANNNPLNTTQGGYAGHAINSVGVMNYNSYEDSIKANLQALNNGRYGPVINALHAGNNPQAVAQAVGASPWGTSGDLMNKILGEG